MTFLTERIAELRKHLDHLYELRPRVSGAASLHEDLSLHNDVLFSLLTVTQLLIDIAGELSARSERRFSDYTGAVRNLAHHDAFPGALVARLEKLPGFRNVLLHDYVELDYDIVVDALADLTPLEQFFDILVDIEAADDGCAPS